MEKKRRTTAKIGFTKNLNILSGLIDNDSQSFLVTEQFEKFKGCFQKLENAQEAFIEVTDIDIENHADGLKFMDNPYEQYNTVLARYSTYLKTSEETERTQSKKKEEDDRASEKEVHRQETKEKFRCEAAKLEVAIDTFGRTNGKIEDSIADAPVSDKRKEWQKIEAEFDSLKSLLLSVTELDPTEDTSAISKKFVDVVEKTYFDAKRWMMSQLKDSTEASSRPTTINDRTTKTEKIALPEFKGDEKESPYLKYPIWRKQWDSLISQYQDEWRDRLLFKHVDDVAKSKFIGYESNYEVAMKRLDSFFGNRDKVVACVMKEVHAAKDIVDGDYSGLLTYSSVLENNFNRLHSMKAEHEMSNTTIMTKVLRKFPRSVSEKWIEHLNGQSSSVKSLPFPEFIVWISSMRGIWEQMSVVDQKVRPSKSSSSFYGDSDSCQDGGNRQGGPKCYNCGDFGHKQRFCTKKKDKGQRTRDPPKIKKFWCALHKDHSKTCFSASCQELRRMTDVNKRIQLLKENNDCSHCCGDHKPEDCRKKDRVCGNGQAGRGCAQAHHTHELFCATAVCFTVQRVNSAKTEGDSSEGVLLLIMNVMSFKRGSTVPVFWDLGSSSNFVLESYAKKCGFKGREEHLSVTTLGGVTTDYYTVIEYTCYIRSMDGTLEKFEAYGMESITGALTTIGTQVIRRLFPNLDERTISNLKRAKDVVYLLGMKHPSWHPERAERARGEGDLWLYRGRFGACIGGRHLMIKEETRKSSSLFVVNHVYHVNTVPCRSIDSIISHELEHCPKRYITYYEKPESQIHETQNRMIETPIVDETVNEHDTGEIPSVIVADMITNTNGSSIINMENVSVPPTTVVSTETASLSNDIGEIVGASNTVSIPCECVCSNNSIHPTFCFGTKAAVIDKEMMFFQLESLGTVINPSCGGCKCCKCPIPGSKYSFEQQRQLDTIIKNLVYDREAKRWFTSYPWKVPRDTLPKNDKAAYQCLLALERRLSKDKERADNFVDQIQAMVDRGSAIILSADQIERWKGDYYYIPLIGVQQPTKWFRICFDASRRQAGGPSLNECLYKGPDRYMNNLLSVIIGFRNGRVGAVADISKFHNQVHLCEEDIHMQRFLWRGMKTDEAPKTYAVKVNNFGVAPANVIATSALHSSADKYQDVYPEACRDIKEQIYIDDELVAAENKVKLVEKTVQMDEITAHAGMRNKGWIFSGDDTSSPISIGSDDPTEDKVLGIMFDPKTDNFKFQVKLRLKRYEADGSVTDVEVLTTEELDEIWDSVLITCRIFLSNVSRIFDPAGFVSPVTLESKIILREIWCGKIGWDDPLPKDQCIRCLHFLKSLLDLHKLRIPRSIWPQGDVIGHPILVVFSDGSISAFGVAAYSRWELRGGGFWSTLITSKAKIAPKRIVSIPRMELCGALAGNRIKNFLIKETNLEFSKIYHLVDSSTVLGYVHKESGNFGPYEGTRISEIQSSNEFENDKLKCWAWVPGSENPADWCTKPRTIQDLGESEFFYSGPSFLRLKEEDWPIKYSYRTDKLEGEIDSRIRVTCAFVEVRVSTNVVNRLLARGSSWKRIVRALAWLIRICQPLERRTSGALTCDEVRSSKRLIVKEAQREIESDLNEAATSGKGKFRKLAPVKDQEGIWRVGSRLRNYVPFTKDANMPQILPTQHRATLLLMRLAHQFSHSGQDGTLSRFHANGYWTVRAGHIARTVKNQCVPCRKITKITLSQPMGEFTLECLNSKSAWAFCQLDLFGPYLCRESRNSRRMKKTWGMIIEDVNSGAVHLDVVEDYSTSAVLSTLRQFGSLRGFPGVMCSDPGSQLESAKGELENWWVTMGRALRDFATSIPESFRWDVSPADSPWRQGKAERRIAIVKKLLTLAVGDSHLTPLELQTAFSEIANICNERPLGLNLKPREDGSFTLITPNELMIGRSGNKVPDDAELAANRPMKDRYRMVQHVSKVYWDKWAKMVLV